MFNSAIKDSWRFLTMKILALGSAALIKQCSINVDLVFLIFTIGFCWSLVLYLQNSTLLYPTKSFHAMLNIFSFKEGNFLKHLYIPPCETTK